MPVPSRIPGPGAALRSAAPRATCPRCGDVVVPCRDALDQLVPVHPVAVPGGELIVNASQSRIVQVLSSREASAAHRRGELGFLPHSRVCRSLGYAS